MFARFIHFKNEKKGAALILFAIAAVPLMAGAGIAVDSAFVYQRRASLQNAVDMAALAAAKVPAQQGMTQGSPLSETLRAMMLPQMQQAGLAENEWSIVSATDTDNVVSLTAEATIRTRLLGLMHKESLTVQASADVSRAQKKLEIVLVMDNTGSMATNDRIGALRTAARTLVDTLYANPNAQNIVKVALVPFVTAVNIKVPSVFDMAWMDTNAQATHHGENFNPPSVGGKTNHFNLFTDLAVTWRGCVEARAAPYDVQDTPPDPAHPDSLFVPWLWPDEPDNGPSYTEGTSYNNNYMPDNYTKPADVNNNATAAARQRNTSKYAARKSEAVIDETPSTTSGPNKSCADPLTPLTNDADLMRSRIAAMMPWNNSGTNIAQGLMWGWSVLSPTPPFTEGAPYTDPMTEKIMIVLTDGENEVYGGWNTHNKSDYSAYNYLGRNRLGTTDRATGVTRVNEKVTTLCNAIKEKNIRLYTITFQLGSATAQTLFRTCATAPSMYFNSPSTTELTGIFQTIASQIGSLRYTR
jgi:Flp pilus assembly protein TadG